jgi:hypothetical protein
MDFFILASAEFRFRLNLTRMERNDWALVQVTEPTIAGQPETPGIPI